MLLTTLAVCPGGRQSGRRRIAVLAIANLGLGTGSAHDYLAQSVDDEGTRLAGVVTDHQRSDGPLVLVNRATACPRPWPVDGYDARRELLRELTAVVRLDLLDRLLAVAVDALPASADRLKRSHPPTS